MKLPRYFKKITALAILLKIGKFSDLQYSTAQYSTIQYNTIQYSAVQSSWSSTYPGYVYIWDVLHD